jgi:hypothetical protein
VIIATAPDFYPPKLNFDAIYDGYVAANPTLERFLDTLTRLEREIFNIDRPAPKGHRIAQVKAGSLLNLQDYFEPFQKAKSTTVSIVTRSSDTFGGPRHSCGGGKTN